MDLTPLPELLNLGEGDEKTVGQRVYQRLRNAVMIGRIPPGRPLTIRELAETLNVSFMPIREALRLLSAERALEVLENRRVQVPVMTPEKFRELCELRVAIETYAAMSAMPFVTPEKIKELEVLDVGIDEAHASGDFESAIAFNVDFHRAIYTANPHQQVMPLLESVWLQLGPFVRLALSRLDENYPKDRHVEAIEALRRSDPIAVRVAIEADIRDGMSHVGTTKLLERYVEERSATSR